MPQLLCEVEAGLEATEPTAAAPLPTVDGAQEGLGDDGGVRGGVHDDGRGGPAAPGDAERTTALTLASSSCTCSATCSTLAARAGMRMEITPMARPSMHMPRRCAGTSAVDMKVPGVHRHHLAGC